MDIEKAKELIGQAIAVNEYEDLDSILNEALAALDEKSESSEFTKGLRITALHTKNNSNRKEILKACDIIDCLEASNKIFEVMVQGLHDENKKLKEAVKQERIKTLEWALSLSRMNDGTDIESTIEQVLKGDK